MAFQWRKFQFFDKDLLADGDASAGSSSSASLPSSLFSDGFVPSCCSSGRGHLVFGDARGTIKIVNRDHEEQKWAAYESQVLHVQQLRKSNVLVSVGVEGGPSGSGAGVTSPSPAEQAHSTTIKIWRLDKTDADGTPMLARAIKVFSSKFPAVPVTSFAVLEDLSQLALGLGNGAVMLFDGNLLRDRNVKQALIQGQGPTVVAVHFREPDSPPLGADGLPLPSSGSSKAPQPISLFVVTTATVSTIYTKHPRLPREEIDSDNGCEELLGTCVNEPEKRLVVTTKDAVFFYEPEEKREAYGFEGSKKIAAWFNGYLVLVCPNKSMDSGAAAAAGGMGGREALGTDTLTIYDLKNKFIAYTFGRFDSIALVCAEFSSLFVVTHKRQLFQLSEHDLHSKMDKLFKMNLYQISIALASNAQRDRSFVMDIFQRYGDHLYSKGDFDGAISQYLQTIGYVEPSYVIRKFLDAARIHNLTRYLQALHEQGRANKDHTTLLLNCVTKLKDVAKLDQFVAQSGAGGAGGGLSFDVVTAINVCRQANYFDHALYLARKHQRHDLYLAIQVDDTANLADALAYIASLPDARDVDRFVKLYGSKLMLTLPQETTTLLKDLCSPGWTPTPMRHSASIGGEKASSLQIDLLAPPSASMAASAAASPSSASASSSGSMGASGPANPAEFIHLFVEHPDKLEQFLSAFIDDAQGNSGPTSGVMAALPAQAQTILYNTLMELYLRRYAAEEKAAKEKAAAAAAAAGGAADSSSLLSVTAHPADSAYARAYSLVKSAYGRYDAAHALVLCKMYCFEKGILHLYEKMKLYHEILAYHIEHRQAQQVLRAAAKYADRADNRGPNLWLQALSYFAAQSDPFEEEIQTVLQAITERKLLPPLMILQQLAANPNKQLSVVKGFIIRALAEEQQLIQANQEEIARYQTETQAMREEIHRLHTQPITFQGLKCHQCSSLLSLPAIHYLCKHSFHARCVVDTESECPKCAQQYRQVRGIRDSMKATAAMHETLFKKLEDEQDGFSVVAEYFGRGLFEPPAEPDEAADGATGRLPGGSP